MMILLGKVPVDCTVSTKTYRSGLRVLSLSPFNSFETIHEFKGEDKPKSQVINEEPEGTQTRGSLAAQQP
jgi:hypothetical protein